MNVHFFALLAALMAVSTLSKEEQNLRRALGNGNGNNGNGNGNGNGNSVDVDSEADLFTEEDVQELAQIVSEEEDWTVDFLESEEGEIFMVYRGPADQDLPSGINDEGIDPVDMFARISKGKKEDAPGALIAAEARMKNKIAKGDKEERPAILEEDQPVEDPNRRLAGSVTYKPRLGNFCASHTRCYAFMRCYERITGNYAIADYAYRLVSDLQPYRGTVCHKIQERSLGWWRSKISQCVTYYQRGIIQRWGVHRTRKAVIYSGDGDGYHWAVFNYC